MLAVKVRCLGREKRWVTKLSDKIKQELNTTSSVTPGIAPFLTVTAFGVVQSKA